MNKPVKRKFMLGDDWFYYKIYSGPKFLDKLLVAEIYPIIQQLREQQLIDQFFFIRYRDPQYHIRLRFRLKNKESIGPVILKLNDCLSPYVENRTIWNVTSEIYKRELERYGERTMEAVESLFYDNSISILDYLKSISQEDDGTRWVWGLHYVDTLLGKIGYTLERKAELAKLFSSNFSHEFDLNKLSREKLSAKYRKDAPVIDRVISGAGDCPYFVFREEAAAAVTAYPEIAAGPILGSVLHMHFNRLFRNKQRAYEFLIYHHLEKFYRSMIARKKQEAPVFVADTE